MKLKPMVTPKPIEIDKEAVTDRAGRFTISPLERGFGVTLGNALRRMLLSSIQGAAITRIRIDGVLQEFSTIPGVHEDVVEIILNLKKLRFKLFSDETLTLNLKVKGKREYRGEDIDKNPLFQLINPEQKILTVTDAKVSFNLELVVEPGRGYVPAESLKRSDDPVGTIPLDAVFSPVTAVNYQIDSIRVGTRTDYDRLVVEIKTDGTVTPVEAMVQAAALLRFHFSFVTALRDDAMLLDEGTRKSIADLNASLEKKGLTLVLEPKISTKEQLDAEHRRIREILKRSIDELEISVRMSNCLKSKNIQTLGDLVRKSGKELLSYDNFGRKSLKELEKMLERMSLHLEMDADKYLKEDIF